MFFDKVVAHGSFKVIASGSRANAFSDFCAALKQHPQEFVVLLVDSESEVSTLPWEHLKNRTGDQWQRPANASDDQVQLMVQVMESWFLADHEALAGFYGPSFLRSALPRQHNIEKIDKDTVFGKLRHASRSTQKGEYHKTRHGFGLLERIDPALVRAASTHADRLLAVLERETRPA